MNLQKPNDSAGDVLRDAGYTMPDQRAEALELMWRYDNHHRGIAGKRRRITPEELLVGAQMFPTIVDDYADLEEDGKFNPAMACWLKQCFFEAEPEAGIEFSDRMFLGRSEFDDDPIDEFRVLLDDGDGYRPELANDIAAAVIRLWNAEYLNEIVSLDRVLKAEGIPYIAGRLPRPWVTKGAVILA